MKSNEFESKTREAALKDDRMIGNPLYPYFIGAEWGYALGLDEGRAEAEEQERDWDALLAENRKLKKQLGDL